MQPKFVHDRLVQSRHCGTGLHTTKHSLNGMFKKISYRHCSQSDGYRPPCLHGSRAQIALKHASQNGYPRSLNWKLEAAVDTATNGW